MENLFTTTIPVPPEMVADFTAWAEHYGMIIKRQSRGSDYFTVNYSDGVDLYWLAANLFGNIPTSSLSQHGPDSVVKARRERSKRPGVTSEDWREINGDSDMPAPGKYEVKDLKQTKQITAFYNGLLWFEDDQEAMPVRFWVKYWRPLFITDQRKGLNTD